MFTPEIAAWAWVVLAGCIAALASWMFLISAVLHRRRVLRVQMEERMGVLALAVLTTADQRAAATLRDLVVRDPAAGFDVICRLLWLVRGTWKVRLRQIVDDPAVLALCRHWVCRPKHVLCGLAAQVLGLAGHDQDLPLLEALTHHLRPVAGGAAVGILHGWPVSNPLACSVMVRLEERRPDLLRALLPHLDRQQVQERLTSWAEDPTHLPLAVFVAGRLGLVVSSPAIRAAMRHPRVQVRRAACIALHDPEHRECRAILADLAEKDVDLLVRVAAIRTMGRWPYPHDLPALRHLLETVPWLVQSHVVQAILAHGEPGERLLRLAQGALRSGPVRWIRELAPGHGASS